MPLSRNLGTLTSWNPLGLTRPVTGLLYLLLNQLPNGVLGFRVSLNRLQKYVETFDTNYRKVFGMHRLKRGTVIPNAFLTGLHFSQRASILIYFTYKLFVHEQKYTVAFGAKHSWLQLKSVHGMSLFHMKYLGHVFHRKI